MFVALEPRRLYRQVAEQIRALIEAGELKPGTRLPPERELAERFAVSRPTVREALIVLEVEGHIQIRMGSGVYISQKSQGSGELRQLEDTEGPLEILQARCLIESAIAEEAARRVTRAGLQRIDATLERMARSLDDPEVALGCDRDFHTAIADMIGNSALKHFTGLIYDSRMSPYFTKLASYFEGPHTWKLALEEHHIIRDALATGDPAAAREAMRSHLTLAQKRFSESFGEEQPREK
ncbi:GntR family transcriptional regulator [Rhizobium sp. Root149]|jgi:DNA-binding FadR family transcriptional regulator|uniref:DNA-binding FadR family transcriptional regulator n=1 Tax=Rhizobium rhizoryzae TaxID=451876 RepID=A0A7W6PRU8_9HYPH|nr:MULTISPECIES: FadR/GntR family transcriptional regulator [Rhizobium]KQZ48558.1 GntR family transcriptional regulator [Rhizobium sp. Root149]MBB4144329.1 DNA-binding FadR family transcriptional regulator [Rhizobium rhizoryzae]